MNDQIKPSFRGAFYLYLNYNTDFNRQTTLRPRYKYVSYSRIHSNDKVNQVQRGQQSYLVGCALNPLHDGGIIGGLNERFELRGLDGGEVTGRGGGGSDRSNGLRFRGLTTNLGLDDGTEDEDAVSRKDGASD